MLGSRGLWGLVVGVVILMNLTANARPNIVHILLDDFGYGDFPNENADIVMPHVSALLEKSVQLSRLYGYKYCSPSRASLFMGRYAPHTGMWNNNLGSMTLRSGWPLNFTFLPEMLRSVGYSTHLAGKFHGGFYKAAHTPTRRGFDSFLGYYGGMFDKWTHMMRGNAVNGSLVYGVDVHNDSATEPLQVFRGENCSYSASLLGDSAVGFVANAPEPFFLAYTPSNTHCPNESPQWALDMQPARVTWAGRRLYAAMATAVDVEVGRVVQQLMARGVWGNTLLVLSSDNGQHVQSYGYGGWTRGAKFTEFEGGVRVVGLVSGGLLPTALHNTTYDGLIHFVDWFPTYAALANATPPSGLDGTNIWPSLITSSPTPSQAVLIAASCLGEANITLHCSVDDPNFQGVLVTPQYKLIASEIGGQNLSAYYPMPPHNEIDPNAHLYHPPTCGNYNSTCVVRVVDSPPFPCSFQQPCLFDLQQDQGESTNIASQHPSLVSNLTRTLKDLVSRNGGFFPSVVAFKQPDDAAIQTMQANGGFWMPWVS